MFHQISYTSMYWNYYNLAATERTGLELSLEHNLGKLELLKVSIT